MRSPKFWAVQFSLSLSSHLPTHTGYIQTTNATENNKQLKSTVKIPTNRETTCPGLVASYSHAGIYSLYHHIDFNCISCSQTHWLSLGNPSPETSLFAHIQNGVRRRYRPRTRQCDILIRANCILFCLV